MTDKATKINRITENMSLTQHWANYCIKMEKKYAACTQLSPSRSNEKKTKPFWTGKLNKAREDYKAMVVKRRQLIEQFNEETEGERS